MQTQDIIDLINQDDEIAVVMLSGVQYYTGQFFEIEKITRAGKEAVGLKKLSKRLIVCTKYLYRVVSLVGILLMLLVTYLCNCMTGMLILLVGVHINILIPGLVV